MPFSRDALKRSDGGERLIAHVAALAPDLGTGRTPAPASLRRAEDAKRLAERGFFTLGRAEGDFREPLRCAVDAVVRDDLPGVLAYLFDAMWGLGEGVRTAASDLLAAEYVLASDAWAWSIAPGKGRRGWTPHRGIAHEVFERVRPQVINVWVALSDVEIDRACMHVVPLDDDPGYPHALATVEVPEGRAVALPVAAGTALAWNANALHWGGECSPGAKGPRTSCSFTLVREDAVKRIGLGAVSVSDLDLPRRLELVADQIAIYGKGQPDVDADFLSWAAAMRAFR